MLTKFLSYLFISAMFIPTSDVYTQGTYTFKDTGSFNITTQLITKESSSISVYSSDGKLRAYYNFNSQNKEVVFYNITNKDVIVIAGAGSIAVDYSNS